MLKISTAPHMSSPVDTPILMRDVVIALMPAAIVSVLFFGLAAIVVIISSVAACMLCEYAVCRWLLHKKSTLHDYSAIITGLLLAYNLPAGFPVWMILIGAFVAIVISKMAFGGLGKNIFNPALVGRVFLFVSFPLQMTTWPKPHFLDFWSADAQTGATTLGILKQLDTSTSATALSKYGPNLDDLPNYWQMFIGYTELLANVYRLHWWLPRRSFGRSFAAWFGLYAVEKGNKLAHSVLLSQYRIYSYINTLADQRFSGL